MRASDLVLETASAFNSNRARSLLTVLGVVIGIAAVIAMTAIIGGVKTALVGEMGLSQARLVRIYLYQSGGMDATDIQDMARDLDDSFEAIIPVGRFEDDVSSATKKAKGQIMGVEPEYADIMDLSFAQGRFFNQKEALSGAQCVVLEEDGVKKLFGSPDTQVVGQTVLIGGAEYQIVGVVESSDSGSSSLVQLYLPFSTYAQRVSGNTKAMQAMAQARSEDGVEAGAEAVRKWIANRYQIPEEDQEEDVYVVTMKSILEELNAMMTSFQMLMTVVASISLLVGGIGIMNMMLTNVTERIREIGLRKALGARRRDITRQFLLESVCLTLAGGVFGILFGMLGAYALAGVTSSMFGMTESMSVQPSIGADAVALVAGICVLIGIVFGYYPARRAAKLDPVESLHYQ